MMIAYIKRNKESTFSWYAIGIPNLLYGIFLVSRRMRTMSKTILSNHIPDWFTGSCALKGHEFPANDREKA